MSQLRRLVGCRTVKQRLSFHSAQRRKCSRHSPERPLKGSPPQSRRSLALLPRHRRSPRSFCRRLPCWNPYRERRSPLQRPLGGPACIKPGASAQKTLSGRSVEWDARSCSMFVPKLLVTPRYSVPDTFVFPEQAWRDLKLGIKVKVIRLRSSTGKPSS